MTILNDIINYISYLMQNQEFDSIFYKMHNEAFCNFRQNYSQKGVVLWLAGAKTFTNEKTVGMKDVT